MKQAKSPKMYEVKLLRGIVGEDGKNVKAGTTIKCKSNFAKTLVYAGRGEITESKG